MKPSEKTSLAGNRSPVTRLRNDSTATPSSTSFLSAIMRIGSITISPAAKERLLLVVSIVCLVAATVTERVTFKVVADRMVPYRLVLTQMILVISVLIYGVIWQLKQGFSNRIAVCMKEFPQTKLLIIAAIDAVQFAGLVISATGVSPVVTVLLMHASTVFLVMASRHAFPERKYSSVQMRGVQLIALAVTVSLVGSFLDTTNPSSQMLSDPYSSVLYLAMCALQGFSTLCKEKMIVEWSKPVDIHYLSSRLFVFQVGIVCFLAPFIYLLQGYLNGSDYYPFNSILSNIGDGFFCFLGFDPTGDTSYDSRSSECSYSYFLVLTYVLCNVVVLECMDRILQAKNQILDRSMAFAVCISFSVLTVYDDSDYFGADGFAADVANIIAVIILLIGIEIYSKDSEPDSEALTAFITP